MIGHSKIGFVERSVLEIEKVRGEHLVDEETRKTFVHPNERGLTDVVTVLHRVLERSTPFMCSGTSAVFEVGVNR